MSKSKLKTKQPDICKALKKAEEVLKKKQDKKDKAVRFVPVY